MTIMHCTFTPCSRVARRLTRLPITLRGAANKFIEVETIPEREIAVAQAAAAILAL